MSLLYINLYVKTVFMSEIDPEYAKQCRDVICKPNIYTLQYINEHTVTCMCQSPNVKKGTIISLYI